MILYGFVQSRKDGPRWVFRVPAIPLVVGKPQFPICNQKAAHNFARFGAELFRHLGHFHPFGLVEDSAFRVVVDVRQLVGCIAKLGGTTPTQSVDRVECVFDESDRLVVGAESHGFPFGFWFIRCFTYWMMKYRLEKLTGTSTYK